MSIRAKLTMIMLAIGLAPLVLIVVMSFSSLSSGQLQMWLLVILVVSTAANVTIALYFTRAFARPILQIAEVVQRYTTGDFSTQTHVVSRDEVGTLAQSVNSMGQSMYEYLGRLQAQQNRLTVILNSAAEGILATDERGIVLLCNAAAARLAGRSADTLVGQSLNDVFNWTQDMRTITIDYGKPGTQTYPNIQYTDTAGDQHYLNLLVTNLSGDQQAGSPQTIVTIHDETKGRDLDNMKVDFVSMAAHELRTPLAAMRGYLELIRFKEGENMAPDVKSYLAQALKSTGELSGLIDNLLGVTRIERGTLTLRPEKLDLAADIQQAVRNASFIASDRRIKLSYDGPASGYIVLADQIALHEVINNLINNAIKYTNPGGSISVTLSQDGPTYVAEFTDTGIGIPKDAIPNLFTKFYRVHGGLNSGSTGTGLGLFISKSIIERHGGTISVVSEQGKGSTFTMTIPVINQSTMMRDRPTQRGNHGWTTKNIAR